MPVRSYGVNERKTAAGRFDVALEELENAGYTIIESGFSRQELDVFRSGLDNLLTHHWREFGGRDVLDAIGEAEQIRAPMAQDPQFLRVARNDCVLDIMQRLLGGYFILNQQNAIINAPSDSAHQQTSYHRDIPYQHFVTSRPIAVNALLCLDPFEAENGPTNVLPGSHRQEAFPSDDYVQRNERPIIAPAGSYILMNSMLYHRAGHNRSNRVRRAVNNVYSLAFVKQQIVLPALLGGKWSDDPTLARFLGYDSDPARSVSDFLARRARRIRETATRG